MPWDSRVDVWSSGCVIAELILGVTPFHGESVPRVLASQVALCGPMPWPMIQWSPALSALFFTNDRQVYEVDPAGQQLGVYLLAPAPNASLGVLLRAAMGGAAGETIVDLALSCLTLDPNERIGAQETMQHASMAAVAWADVHDDSAHISNLILSSPALQIYL